MTQFGAPQRARAQGAISRDTEAVLASLLDDTTVRCAEGLAQARSAGALASTLIWFCVARRSNEHKALY